MTGAVVMVVAAMEAAQTVAMMEVVGLAERTVAAEGIEAHLQAWLVDKTAEEVTEVVALAVVVPAVEAVTEVATLALVVPVEAEWVVHSATVMVVVSLAEVLTGAVKMGMASSVEEAGAARAEAATIEAVETASALLEMEVMERATAVTKEAVVLGEATMWAHMVVRH